MFKTSLAVVVVTLILTILPFAALSFAELSPNPFQWQPISRFALGMAASLAFLFAVANTPGVFDQE